MSAFNLFTEKEFKHYLPAMAAVTGHGWKNALSKMTSKRLSVNESFYFPFTCLSGKVYLCCISLKMPFM